MIGLTVLSSVVDDTTTELMGISDLETVIIGTDVFLYVASESNSAITSFKLSGNGSAELVDTLSYSATSGTLVLSDIIIADVAGVPVLLPSGRYDDDVVTYDINSVGQLINPQEQSPDGTDLGGFYKTHTVNVDGKTYLFVSERGQSGLESYRMKPDGSWVVKDTYGAPEYDFLGDVETFESATIDGKTYLFTASAFDAGISSFQVGTHGNLTLKGTIAPDDGSGFATPQALTTVATAGATYVIMASSGTNSLTVFQVGNDGSLVETDHVMDLVSTRFQDASVLDSFTYNGRAFVLAAGSDGGVTLFELTPNGTLSVLSVLADDFDTTLSNISDIEVVQIGGEIHILVSSQSEDGFTQIAFDLSTVGSSIVGQTTHETLTGTAVDDLILGNGGSDTLYGADGDDRLVDGKGKDHLYGGEGADVFQFVEDGKKDIIYDFDIDEDRIDLTQISSASHIASLDIKSRSFGAVILVGDEEIKIITDDGTRLYASDFSSDDFIF